MGLAVMKEYWLAKIAAQNETLMKDVRRLRKVCEFQVIHQQQKQKQQIPKRPIHRHSSLPLDFGIQMQQNTSPNSSIRTPPIFSPDSLTGMMKNISLTPASNNEVSREGGFSNVTPKDSLEMDINSRSASSSVI